jgi:starvation-inducible DNA-binding protein
MEPKIGIDSSSRKEVAAILGKVLADEFLLYTKTRNAHWNVEGPDFYDKHKFFEAQYEQLDEIMDDVAERIRSIGHYAPGTLKDFLRLTQFSEQSRHEYDSHRHIQELLTDHENLVIYLRTNISRVSNELHDEGTTDFITGLMVTHEKMAWMLRSHLL